MNIILLQNYSHLLIFLQTNRQKNQKLLQSALSNVEIAYQNLESVELGITSVDHYFDTLGGISRAVKRARGGAA